ncbi:MAG: hypothetical protein WBC44_06265 [Planctomycetaceae bacterium]
MTQYVNWRRSDEATSSGRPPPLRVSRTIIAVCGGFTEQAIMEAATNREAAKAG